MALKLTQRSVDGVKVIECSGRIVFGQEATELRDEVKKELSETNRIVLNLANVSYIDSGGIGTLVSLFTSARNSGGDIKLANLTKRVSDLLQITKLVTVFESYDSEEKAVKAFGTSLRGAVSVMASRKESA
jgi:anti-sigma B factor antagonist